MTPHRRTLARNAPDAEEILRLVVVVAERLEPRSDELNASMHAAIAEGIDELASPELSKMMYASVEANVTTIVQAMRHDIPLDHIQPIAAATEYAVRLAREGIPSASLRRAYHFGSDDLLAQIFLEVQALDTDAETRLRLLHHLAGWLHAYVDRITRQVLEAYDAERRLLDEQSASLTSSLVRRILDGGTDAAVRFSDRTGYLLDQLHLAATVWIDDANPAVDHTPALAELSRELATTLGAGHPLFTITDRSTAWVWFGLGRDDEPDLAATRPVVTRHDGARVAFGRPARGTDGFRETRDAADAARRVALVAEPTPSVVAYDDPGVVVLAMLVHDTDRLAEWVRSVLGPLAIDDDSTARLRETLLEYLAQWGSYRAVGETMALHRNSVRYRVQRAIKLRGRPIGADRADLELALRTAQLLGGRMLVPPQRDDRRSANR
jgi:DNA-binding PucR family transcriptional regulator